MKRKTRRRVLILLCALLALVLTMGVVDFFRVYYFEKPLFAVCVQGADDGGSGIYRGLGYGFHITGNFMPEDEFPGVTKYEARILGFPVLRGIRD